MNTKSPVVRFPFCTSTPGSLLAVAVFLLSAGAQAQEPRDFSDVVIFATNSVHINQGVMVSSGDVVVNDSSPGPVLNAGVELSIMRTVTIAGNAMADSINLSNKANILGTRECNAPDSSGVVCTGLALPVFFEVPAFQEAVLRTEPPLPHDPGLGEDVAVGLAEEKTLDAGFYGDITIDKGGRLVFSGGVYNIGSIMPVSTTGGPCSPDPCRRLEFQAPTDLRIFGRFDTNKDALIGPEEGSGISAADIVIYVGSSNLDPTDPSSLPPAATVGQRSTIEANFYAANGTIKIDKDSFVEGALLGRDIWIDKNTEVFLNTYFFDRPPVAFSQDVATEGAVSVDIILEGSDPEGGVLTFGIFGDPDPLIGSLGPITQQPLTNAVVTYTPVDRAADLADSFLFTVTDEAGNTDVAEVRINPPGDPTDPPPTPTDTVFGKDDSLEAVTNTELGITLVGFADVADPSAVGDFTFSIISGPTNGTLDPDPPTPSVPSASDLAPPVPADLFDSVRTAETTYIPNLDFEGSDSFVFEVCGDLSVPPDGDTADLRECDEATVSITVGDFNPPPPPEAPVAEDQTVTIPEDTQVIIDLSTESGGGSTVPRPTSSGPAGAEEALSSAAKSGGGDASNNGGVFSHQRISKDASGRSPSIPMATALTIDGGWTFFNDCAIGTACPDGPFTFSIASGGACVSVTDLFLKSDEYTVADNGLPLGSTSAGVPDDSVSQTDPDLAFADANYSSGTFVVGSGSHSIDVTRNAGLPGLAAAYIRVDSPGTAYCSAFTNLTATSFSAPTEADLGDVIGGQIQVTVTNTGTVDIAGTTLSAIGFYVSTDAVITTSDTLLTGGRENLSPTGLAAGASITDFLFAGASINTGSPEGDVFIGVLVDEGNTVSESDETDNTASQAIRIGPPKPDLVVSSLTHTPGSPESNSQIDFVAEVKNIGNGPAGASTLCFPIGDEPCSANTYFDVQSLNAGESVEVQRTGQLLAGSYSYTAEADILGEVDESDESNNSASDTFVVADAVDGLFATITTLPTSGSLFDQNGVAITSTGPISGTQVTYLPTGTTSAFFEFTITNTSTGLTSGVARVDLTIAADVIVDPCAIQGRPTGCIPG